MLLSSWWQDTPSAGTLMSLIYIFHMPLFFITAGYFFSSRNVEQPWTYCCKRFKGLYVPFVKWSLFFLLIHNVMFQVGILNEPTATGRVA